jgi:hypothetical protein
LVGGYHSTGGCGSRRFLFQSRLFFGVSLGTMISKIESMLAAVHTFGLTLTSDATVSFEAKPKPSDHTWTVSVVLTCFQDGVEAQHFRWEATKDDLSGALDDLVKIVRTNLFDEQTGLRRRTSYVKELMAGSAPSP